VKTPSFSGDHERLGDYTGHRRSTPIVAAGGKEFMRTCMEYMGKWFDWRFPERRNFGGDRASSIE